MLAALLPLPGGVRYMKMTYDAVTGWGRGESQAGEQTEVERRVMEEEEQEQVRDGQQGVGLSVPLCLLQPVPLLQHVM